MANLDITNSKNLAANPHKSNNFIESTKNAVRKVLVKTGIAASTMAPMASTTTSTVIPASVNTISAIAPTASTVIKTISLGTAAGLLAACGGEDGPDGPIETKDTTPPTINVNKSEVDITGGKEIRISGNQLYIGDILVASWSDNKTRNCSVSLSLNGKSITSGTTISEEGTLNIKVSDEAGNIKNVNINLSVEKDILGLESLKNLSMQVDQEIDLLNGVSFGNGAKLEKVEIEIDGEKTEISDPNHYIPAYPGECNIILTVKDKNGKTTEYRVDNLTIKPLDYNEIEINDANMISEKYPRYNNLQQSTRDFIYPHLLSSYAACNWSKQDNRVHIIMGETADTDDIENIGTSGYDNTPSSHAYEGYYRIRALSPDAPIKCCKDYRINLENYINQHPDKIFLVSCADDTGGGNSREEMNNNKGTPPLRRMLTKENVIVIVANGNRPVNWKAWNENIKGGYNYNSGSINSNLNNKITVVGYNSRGANNYFSPNSNYGGLSSSMPVGYEKSKGNIVMPMIPLISSDNTEYKSTYSSFPTAVTSGVIGNATSVIMSNRPGITLEDAMTIIANNYLKEETFQYKDETTNYELTNGGKRYFIEMDKLLKNELLQSSKIDKLQLNSENVELPSSKGICYTGMGIQFEYNGKTYNTTNVNQSILNQALKSGNIKWYWNKTAFRKHGGKGSANLNVYAVDKNGNKLPNLKLDVTKSVN